MRANRPAWLSRRFTTGLHYARTVAGSADFSAADRYYCHLDGCDPSWCGGAAERLKEVRSKRIADTG